MRKTILVNSIIILVVMFCAVCFANNQNEAQNCIVTEETKENEVQVVKEVKEPTEAKIIELEPIVEPMPKEIYNPNEKYLLAKIAMAEAEECSTQTKAYVIMTVLNRVESNRFPNTVEGVIFERHGNTYQFSPIGDGRWYRVEPNEDCWKAVEIALTSNTSQGALFFESCINEDNWHSRNLQFLYKSDAMRFYK